MHRAGAIGRCFAYANLDAPPKAGVEGQGCSRFRGGGFSRESSRISISGNAFSLGLVFVIAMAFGEIGSCIMIEGWSEDQYVILFDDPEIPSATSGYQVEIGLPGFTVIGLCGWDDLIVRDLEGGVFTVPSVPVEAEHLAAFDPATAKRVESDNRFSGRIRWYIKPLVFGGDPNDEANTSWLTHDEHRKIVVWWNQKYRNIKYGTHG